MDDHCKDAEPIERREWVKPEVMSFAAGQAEAATVNSTDGWSSVS